MRKYFKSKNTMAIPFFITNENSSVSEPMLLVIFSHRKFFYANLTTNKIYFVK